MSYLPFNSVHVLNNILKMKVSPVIEYFPVSPVAPPKSTTLYLFTIVIVCPNLACGTFLAISRVSCAWLGSLIFCIFPSGPTPSLPPCLALSSAETMCASWVPF